MSNIKKINASVFEILQKRTNLYVSQLVDFKVNISHVCDHMFVTFLNVLTISAHTLVTQSSPNTIFKNSSNQPLKCI